MKSHVKRNELPGAMLVGKEKGELFRGGRGMIGKLTLALGGNRQAQRFPTVVVGVIELPLRRGLKFTAITAIHRLEFPTSHAARAEAAKKRSVMFMHSLAVLEHVKPRRLLTSLHLAMQFAQVLRIHLRHVTFLAVPESRVRQVMALILGKETGNRRQTPVLIGFKKFGRQNAYRVETDFKLLELRLIKDGKVDVRGMMIAGATVSIRIFNACVAGLYGLLGERNVAASNGIQISFCVLQSSFVHDSLL
jgi:hypothetical protein